MLPQQLLELVDDRIEVDLGSKCNIDAEDSLRQPPLSQVRDDEPSMRRSHVGHQNQPGAGIEHEHRTGQSSGGHTLRLLFHEVAINQRLDQLRHGGASESRVTCQVGAADPLRRSDQPCELALNFKLFEPESAVEGGEARGDGQMDWRIHDKVLVNRAHLIRPQATSVIVGTIGKVFMSEIELNNTKYRAKPGLGNVRSTKWSLKKWLRHSVWQSSARE